jgi:hypothetical protein
MVSNRGYIRYMCYKKKLISIKNQDKLPEEHLLKADALFLWKKAV